MLCAFLSATAQNFQLTRDINTSQNGNPVNYINDLYLEQTITQFNVFYTGNSKYAVIGTITYFAADDGIHGTELWRSDGTAAGTYLVKDITPGSVSTEIQSLTIVGSKLYFTANRMVWISDGTDNGTYQVPGISYTSDITTCLTAVGNSLYFLTNISRLWKTDGTLAGTSLVLDFRQTYNYSIDFLGQLTNVNGTLFFTTGINNAAGPELWKSDGTTAGTVMVKDILPGSAGSNPLHLTAANGKLYFSANDGVTDYLWVSDGTDNGTYKVPNNNGITLQHDNIYPFTVVNNVLCFKGAANATGYELCIYNTAGGGSVNLVKDVNPGANGSSPANITAAGSGVYFTASGAGGKQQLWISNGTAAGTKLVKTGEPGSIFSNLSNANGTLLFSYNTAANGNELWKTTGIPAATSLVKDIFPGVFSASPAYTTYIGGGYCLLSATDERGTELWRSNGMTGETVFVKNINTTTSGNADPNLYDAASLNGKLFFTAHEPKHESELYTSDGTTTGTQLVKDLNIVGASNPVNYTVFNNAVYFSGNSGLHQTIFKSDGSTAGTQAVFNIGNSNGYVSKIAAGKDWLYVFYYNADSSKQELWRTDGTPGGSYRLQDLPGRYSGSAATIGNALYFSESDPEHGAELWKSTGIAGNAALLKDIAPGVVSSYPSGLYAYNNKLYFSAYNGISNTFLYVSDGTETGTKVLKEVQPLGLVTFVQARGKLYFGGSTAETGAEIYISDGTTKGTKLLKDIVPGPGSSYPNSLVVLDSTVYFSANDSLFHIGLWKTIGTTAGTKLVKNVNVSYSIVTAAGKLYFTAYDSLYNYGLWVSNGKASGTHAVTDAGLEGVSINAYTGTDTKLFLNGYIYATGYELYAGASPDEQVLSAEHTSNQSSKEVNIFSAYLTVNPVKDMVKFNVISGKQQAVQLSITDMSGRSLVQGSGSLNGGMNSFTYPSGSWTPGIYLLKLTAADGSVATLKIMK